MRQATSCCKFYLFGLIHDDVLEFRGYFQCIFSVFSVYRLLVNYNVAGRFLSFIA